MPALERAPELAATTLDAAGCAELSARLAREAARASASGTAAVTRGADELRPIAEAIAERVKGLGGISC